MTSKKLFSLVGLLSFFAFGADAQVAEKSNHPNTRSTEVVTRKSTPLKSIFAEKADTALLADNVTLKNKKRVEKLNEEISKNIHDELSIEELNYPAIDLYGKDSWDSSCVNPFAGGRAVEIPDTFNVDCKQFSHPIGNVCRINSRYGYRRRFGRMHYGIDLKLSIGDTVRAAFDGKVRLVAFERRGYGNYVVMRHPNGLETVYGHLSRTLVKENQVVRAGDPIALGGNTGRSTGPHLHFETRFMGVALNPEWIINFDKGIPVNEQFVFLRHKLGIGRCTATAGKIRSHVAKDTSGSIKTHRVRSGDTLSTIASKYGMSVNQLCRLNGLSRKSVLRIGRSLRVG